MCQVAYRGKQGDVALAYGPDGVPLRARDGLVAHVGRDCLS